MIQDPDLFFLPIQDPEPRIQSRGKKGTGSRIRIRNTAFHYSKNKISKKTHGLNLAKQASGMVNGVYHQCSCFQHLGTFLLCVPSTSTCTTNKQGIQNIGKPICRQNLTDIETVLKKKNKSNYRRSHLHINEGDGKEGSRYYLICKYFLNYHRS